MATPLVNAISTAHFALKRLVSLVQEHLAGLLPHKPANDADANNAVTKRRRHPSTPIA